MSRTTSERKQNEDAGGGSVLRAVVRDRYGEAARQAGTAALPAARGCA